MSHRQERGRAGRGRVLELGARDAKAGRRGNRAQRSGAAAGYRLPVRPSGRQGLRRSRHWGSAGAEGRWEAQRRVAAHINELVSYRPAWAHEEGGVYGKCRRQAEGILQVCGVAELVERRADLKFR
jgi:hypothetical protein